MFKSPPPPAPPAPVPEEWIGVPLGDEAAAVDQGRVGHVRRGQVVQPGVVGSAAKRVRKDEHLHLGVSVSLG